jgi:hypothetical protein
MTRASKTTTARDDAATVAGLKRILKPYMRNLHVVSDDENGCYLESKTDFYKGRRMAVAAVRRGKAYVSFHLVMLYLNPDLQKRVSPALRKRMQGKACFNFTQPDPELFAELAALTATTFEFIKKHGFPMPHSLGKPKAKKRAPATR